MASVRYVELVEHSLMNRNNIVPANKVDSTLKRDYPAFASIYTFTDDFFNYVKETNSVTGYVGTHGISNVFIDIDSKELGQAYVSCKNVIAALHNESKIPYESLRIYFSGAKGFHIGIPARVIGQENFFSENTFAIVKSFVQKIVSDKIKIDWSIYNRTRYFRLPNSLNEKSNKYKVAVDYKMILECTEENLAKIISNSEKCINDVSYKIDLTRNDYLERLFEACKFSSFNQSDIMSEISDKDNNVTVNKTLFRIPEEGERNELMYKQAFRLFSQKNMKVNEITDIMRMIWHSSNSFSQNKILEPEFRNIINSAYKGARSKKIEEKSSSIDDLINNVYKNLISTSEIKVGDNDIDEMILEGGFKTGNSYALIGMGGTAKSVFLQQMCLLAARNKKYGIYLNGEMSETQFFSRFCKQALTFDFIEAFKQGKISVSELDELNFKIKSLVENYFGITSRIDMSCEDLESMIDEREQRLGQKMSWLAIDSFGSLAIENGNEIQSLIKNSREIKEVAKRKNIAIVSLNHVSKGCFKHQKDVSNFVRGGNKILDNCDAYFSFATIIDNDKSKIGKNDFDSDFVYLEDTFHLRCVNKRGNGKTIDKIMKLDKDTLTLSFSNARSDESLESPF